VATFDNPIDAINLINNQSVDLIFLDIQMPDLTGTSFARTIDNGTKIIFTTAYEKYALEGFKLDAVDYLLKPFSYEEFLVAAQKAKRLIELEQHATTNESGNEFLFLKSEYKVVRINFDTILYIEGQKDYIRVFLVGEDAPILSLSTLKSIEKKLPESHFMRVHRSFIVNLNFVKAIERSRILFGKEYIPISDQYKDKFQEFINKNVL
jgi:DNA-binding LytR/AlgR family response regulator